MKKPLQVQDEILFTIDGKIRMHRATDVKRLIDAANKFLSKGELEKKISIDAAHFFERSLSVWMTRLVGEGISKNLIADLNTEMKGVRFWHLLMPPEDELPYWKHIADLKSYFRPEVDAAYAFSQQLAIGSFKGLKRCRIPDCQKFFVGRPDAKWCSKACGSRHRVNKKRKRDRQ